MDILTSKEIQEFQKKLKEISEELEKTKEFLLKIITQ